MGSAAGSGNKSQAQNFKDMRVITTRATECYASAEI